MNFIKIFALLKILRKIILRFLKKLDILIIYGNKYFNFLKSDLIY